MCKLPPFLAITLLIAAPVAWAEDDGPDDLRYCLELQSNLEIAKCAGEVSPGDKGKPYSREEVDRILSDQQARAPISLDEAPALPVPGNQVRDVLLEDDEGSGNR